MQLAQPSSPSCQAIEGFSTASATFDSSLALQKRSIVGPKNNICTRIQSNARLGAIAEQNQWISNNK
jgi:hypothetical protein